MPCRKKAYPRYFECPRCCANVFGVGNFAGHRGFSVRRHQKEMQCMALVRRVKSEGSSNGSARPYGTCKFMERYPNMAAFLSQSAWEDGVQRSTGTVTFLADAG